MISIIYYNINNITHKKKENIIDIVIKSSIRTGLSNKITKTKKNKTKYNIDSENIL
jgi:hypothetical protein